MKVVVTGASGFVGRALLARLAAAGLETCGVSRSPGADLLQVASYADSPAGDVLVHLAEDSDRGRVNALGEAYVESAVRTTQALLQRGYAMVIYVSSSTLYGDQTIHPLAADAPTLARDAYARAKLLCEKTVLEHRGLVIRFSNLYGPGMAGNNVLSDILSQLSGEGPLVVQDDSPVRDFLWIGDAVDLILKAIERKLAGVINGGSGTGTSIRELARLILTLAGQATRPVHARQRGDTPSVNVLDISETMKLAHWSPATPLRSGIGLLLQSRPIAD